MVEKIPEDYFDSTGTLKLLWEEEWRGLGITQAGLLKSLSKVITAIANASFAEPGLGAL